MAYTPLELEVLKARLPAGDDRADFVMHNRELLDGLQALLEYAREPAVVGARVSERRPEFPHRLILRGGGRQAAVLLALARETGLEVSITVKAPHQDPKLTVQIDPQEL